MIADNLKLLLQLYLRPRAAMSGIVDEGSLLFAALLVVGVTFVANWPTGTLLQASLASRAAGQEVPPEHAEHMDATEGAPDPEIPMRVFYALGLAGSSTMSIVLALAGLGILYVPALILGMTFIDRRAGSFGVALPRDYGSLAPCVFLAWAASHLPLAAMGLAVAARPEWVGVWMLGAYAAAFLYFLALVSIAVRIVYGVGAGPALGASTLALVALPCAAFLPMLASPFILYLLFMYFRSDVSAIQGSLGSRRSFKRHLEAATINPRDAEAHYQLGLIHQHRRQYPEALARFQKAVEIDPSEIDAHYQLGRIAREEARHADAIRHFEAVVARDMRYARYEIWREVGGTYVDAGDFANARPMLERYVDNRPYDPEGLYLLGLTLKQLGEAEKAREMLQHCVEATRTAPDYRRGELRRWRNKALAEL
jgi:hypothetical protein